MEKTKTNDENQFVRLFNDRFLHTKIQLCPRGFPNF